MHVHVLGNFCFGSTFEDIQILLQVYSLPGFSGGLVEKFGLEFT